MTLVLRRLLLALHRAAFAASRPVAHAQEIEGLIRGLISMGAYRFVGFGGDPVNTAEPLNAKPGIFGDSS